MRILTQPSHRLLASCCHRSVLPRHLTSIQCLGEGTWPTLPPSEPFPGLDHRRKPLAPPLQSTQNTFLSRAPPLSTSPLQVSKIEFILLQDCVGGNLASNSDPKLRFEPSSQQQWRSWALGFTRVAVTKGETGQPPVQRSTLPIRSRHAPSHWLIQALHHDLDSSGSMKSVSWWTALPCTRSMKPWTYSMVFLIEK
jgi:hypothetical protein